MYVIVNLKNGIHFRPSNNDFFDITVHMETKKKEELEFIVNQNPFLFKEYNIVPFENINGIKH